MLTKRTLREANVRLWEVSPVVPVHPEARRGRPNGLRKPCQRVPAFVGSAPDRKRH